MTRMRKIGKGLFLVCVMAVICLAAPVLADSYLGAASAYAVFGLYTTPDGTFVNLHNVSVGNSIVGGDVAVGPEGTCNFAGASDVYGNIYVDPTASASGGGVFHGGSFVTGFDLSAANADAMWAYTDAISRTATQTFGAITSSTTIVGNGGINVISISSISLDSGEKLIFSGGASDFFIVNVTGGLTMGGDGSIEGAGGVDASGILLNFVGTGTKLTSHVDNVVNGTILAPYRSVEFHSANGAVLAGGTELKLMSDCRINYVPLKEVPEPSGLLAMLTGLGGVIGYIRKRRHG